MSEHLSVNPIRCSAHGMCAELVPERVRLDDWGYPIVDGAPLDEGLLRYARQAVKACPVLALKLKRSQQPPGPAENLSRGESKRRDPAQADAVIGRARSAKL